MPTNATYNDAYEDLNVGSGGPRLDASAPPRKDGEARHRQRIVLGGDSDASAVIDPVMVDGAWHLPCVDMEAREILSAILEELKILNDNFAIAARLLPPDRISDNE